MLLGFKLEEQSGVGRGQLILEAGLDECVLEPEEAAKDGEAVGVGVEGAFMGDLQVGGDLVEFGRAVGLEAVGERIAQVVVLGGHRSKSLNALPQRGVVAEKHPQLAAEEQLVVQEVLRLSGLLLALELGQRCLALANQHQNDHVPVEAQTVENVSHGQLRKVQPQQVQHPRALRVWARLPLHVEFANQQLLLRFRHPRVPLAGLKVFKLVNNI